MNMIKSRNGTMHPVQRHIKTIGISYKLCEGKRQLANPEFYIGFNYSRTTNTLIEKNQVI